MSYPQLKPLNKWEIGGIFMVMALLLLLVRDILTVLFLTFIFAYLAHSGLQKLKSWHIKLSHKWATVLVFLTFIVIVSVLGGFIIPLSYSESRSLLASLPPSFNFFDFVRNSLQETFPFLGHIDQNVVNRFLDGQEMLNVNLPKISAALTGFFADTIGLFIKVIISFILAFFIILEKDESKKLLREIEKSSLIGNYYAWCKPYFIVLADSFGETFKSQAIIALLNATLTIIGLYFLGINYLYAFWFIVFIFGFIPVFGMVISSVPIMLVAFFVGGFALVLKVMVLILLIHFIEAYFLNPKIHASRTRLPITFVFIALVVGEYLGGMWGMIIAIPTLLFLYRVFVLEQIHNHHQPSLPLGD